MIMLMRGSAVSVLAVTGPGTRCPWIVCEKHVFHALTCPICTFRRLSTQVVRSFAKCVNGSHVHLANQWTQTHIYLSIVYGRKWLSVYYDSKHVRAKDEDFKRREININALRNIALRDLLKWAKCKQRSAEEDVTTQWNLFSCVLFK